MLKVVTDKITTAHKSQAGRAEQAEERCKIVYGSLLTTSFGMATLKTRMDVEISCDGKQKPRASHSRLNAYAAQVLLLILQNKTSAN